MDREIGKWVSADNRRMAILMEYPCTGMMWLKLYQDDQFIEAETYDGKSVRFYEDAAENYIAGIKQ